MKNILQKISNLLIVSTMIFLSANFVLAAQYNLESENISLRPGDRILVRLTISADNQQVNTLAGKMIYDANQLDLIATEDSQSIISLWVEEPSFPKKAGEIPFSGIIPGGYSEDGGYIFSASFKVKDLEQGTPGSVSVASPEVLLNDGQGTQARVKINNYFYQVNSLDRLPLAPDSLKDTTPPENFNISLGRDESLFDNQWFISFLTQDKGSGVDHYEIKEGWLGRYHPVTSPYQLADQDLGSKVYVKAIDKQGNFVISVLSPKNPGKSYQKYAIYGIIILLILLLVAFLRNKKFKK